MRDLASDLQLPVILVASAALGTLNHSLLSIESIQASGCRIAGIVMNFHQCPDDLASTTNPAILEDLCQLPVLPLNTHQALTELPPWLASFPIP
ncbi:MAG: AAA family ATPase [Blastochloris sp.]|nr:AAA family ATPase [Blastochloris sp.]